MLVLILLGEIILLIRKRNNIHIIKYVRAILRPNGEDINVKAFCLKHINVLISLAKTIQMCKMII